MSDPDALIALIDDVTKAVRRAFTEGYRNGCQDTKDRMIRAATVGLEQRLPSITAHTPLRPAATMRPSKNYGRIINSFRLAIMASPDTGITREELVDYCVRRGIHLTAPQYRETMKRLTGEGEVERHHGAYFPTPNLRRDLAQTTEGGGQDADQSVEDESPADAE